MTVRVAGKFGNLNGVLDSKGSPTHPLLGAIVPEYQREELRERLFQSYRIVYRVRTDSVEIVTISHAARLLPQPPPE